MRLIDSADYRARRLAASDSRSQPTRAVGCDVPGAAGADCQLPHGRDAVARTGRVTDTEWITDSERDPDAAAAGR